MAIDSKALGKQIRAARIRKKITQEQLAFHANITPKYLERIEVGERTPSLDVLVILADAVETGLDSLLAASRSVRKFEAFREVEEIMDDCSREETVFLTKLVAFTKAEIRKIR